MKVWVALDPGYEDEVILFKEEPVFEEDEKYWYSPTGCEYVMTYTTTLRKIAHVNMRDTKHAYQIEIPNEWWMKKTKFT